MIYPQSLSHKVSKWLGLYGAVGNTASTSETITSDSDFLDLTWATDLLIGDANTAVSVIFDTMQNYLILDGCTSGCAANQYDVSLATNSSPSALTSSIDISLDTYKTTKAVYTITNEFYTEKVCFPGATECTSGNINMYISSSVADNPYTNVGGIAGLALNKAASSVPATDTFMGQLVTDGSENKFGFNYGFSGQDSYMYLGVTSTDSSQYLGSDSFTFDVTPDSTYWEVDLVGVKFSTDSADEWGFANTKARFASGVQCIYAPPNQYELLKDEVMKFSLGYYEDSTYGMVVDCEQEDDLPSLRFLLGKNASDEYKWTLVNVMDYLIKIEDSYQCQVCLRDTGSDDNVWYLGATWFAGYYVEFDGDNDQVSIRPASNGGKQQEFELSTSITTSTPDRVYGTNTTTVALLGSGIGLCVILMFTLCILANCYLLFFARKKSTNTKKTSANSELISKLDELIKQ